jgi:hypothetical protein
MQHQMQGTCHPERRARECARKSKDPEDLYRDHATSRRSLHTAVIPFAVRDDFHYKFWVYILASRTGTL